MQTVRLYQHVTDAATQIFSERLPPSSQTDLPRLAAERTTLTGAMPTRNHPHLQSRPELHLRSFV